MIDFKKIPAYKARTEPDIINVPPILFVKVDGEGSPQSDSFQEAIRIASGIFYTIKFWGKKHALPEGYDNFTSAPIEAIWWTAAGQKFDPGSPEEWRWTVMIRVPAFVAPEYFREVIDELVSTKRMDIYKKARLETTHEGFCAQILHVGPYDKEQDSLNRLRKYAHKSGYEIYGRHHEIYLNNPSRSAPEKLKTVLRYPVRKKDNEIIVISR